MSLISSFLNEKKYTAVEDFIPFRHTKSYLQQRQETYLAFAITSWYSAKINITQHLHCKGLLIKPLLFANEFVCNFQEVGQNYLTKKNKKLGFLNKIFGTIKHFMYLCGVFYRGVDYNLY